MVKIWQRDGYAGDSSGYGYVEPEAEQVEPKAQAKPKAEHHHQKKLNLMFYNISSCLI